MGVSLNKNPLHHTSSVHSVYVHQAKHRYSKSSSGPGFEQHSVIGRINNNMHKRTVIQHFSHFCRFMVEQYPPAALCSAAINGPAFVSHDYSVTVGIHVADKHAEIPDLLS